MNKSFKEMENYDLQELLEGHLEELTDIYGPINIHNDSFEDMRGIVEELGDRLDSQETDINFKNLRIEELEAEIELFNKGDKEILDKIRFLKDEVERLSVYEILDNGEEERWI